MNGRMEEWAWRALVVVLMTWGVLEIRDLNQTLHAAAQPTEASMPEELQKSLADMRHRLSAVDAKLDDLHAAVSRLQ